MTQPAVTARLLRNQAANSSKHGRSPSPRASRAATENSPKSTNQVAMHNRHQVLSAKAEIAASASAPIEHTAPTSQRPATAARLPPRSPHQETTAAAV